MTTNVDPKDLLDYVNDLMQRRKTRYEPEWYKNLHSYENNHFMGWNRITGTLQYAPTKKRFFIQLPEVKRQADAFENLLLKQNPIYQVYPTNYADQTEIDRARFQSLFLRQHYLDYNEANIMHELVHNATVMPIAFMEIAYTMKYDPTSGVMRKTTAPRVYDAFDVAFDPQYLFEENQVIVKIVRTTPRRMKQSKLYKNFEGGKVQSGDSDFKELFYQDKFGNNRASSDFERIILYECHIKEDKNGVPGIRIITIDSQGNQLRNDYIDGMPFFSIIPFQPYSGNAYQPSFVQNINPLNRSLDLIANRIESMMMRHVKGAYLMPSNSDVQMSDEDGTILKYTGTPPIVLPIPPIPAAAWQWMNMLMSFSERYGVNQLAMGGTPQGSQMRAAKMMTQALQGAEDQQKTPMENLMYTMKRMAEVILFMESRIMTEPQSMTLAGPASNPQDGTTKKFVGEDYYSLYAQDSSVVPLPKTVTKMTIEIEDAASQSLTAKRTAMLELIEVFNQAPQPLQPIILDLYKVGNTADIMTQLQMGQTILDSPEMQAIIAQNRQGMFNNNPKLKAAIATFLQFLATQSPVPAQNSIPTNGNAQPGEAGGGAPGGAPAGGPPAIAGAPTGSRIVKRAQRELTKPNLPPSAPIAGTNQQAH